MQYNISVITTDNRMQQIQLEASDEVQARVQAELLGHYVSSVKPAAWSLASLLPGLNASGGAFSLLLFSQELLALLQAGLNIVEALEALHEKEINPQIEDLYKHMLHGLREG